MDERTPQPEDTNDNRTQPEFSDKPFKSPIVPLKPHEVPLASFADEPGDADVVAQLVDDGKPPVQIDNETLRKRRVKLPIILFLITCVSTFWVGATEWVPFTVMGECTRPIALFGVFPMPTQFDMMPIRRTLVSHWDDGLIYTASLLAILFTHEMGHFLATVRYRIPASLPYFLPLPISPIGTLGAVIGMDGMRADRKQMFDIGIAGPLAGLVIAIPIMWVGINDLDLTQTDEGGFHVDLPIAAKAAMAFVDPPGYAPGTKIWNTQLNPYFMAGWVGLLITGLNMLPVSQLDGGHVTYTLFGKRAHWIARIFMLVALIFIVSVNPGLIVMFTLVMLVGVDHPPTRDDSVPLGWFRYTLGCLSLSIPLLCFAPRLLMI